MSDAANPSKNTHGPLPLLAVRGVVGGVLMGLANLVPGISGGTMLVAAGIYKQFINAIAELSSFKFRLRSVVLLGSVVAAMGCAIFGLAGWMKDLMQAQPVAMFSLFIGLTLGGVPLLKKMLGKTTASAWVAGMVMFTAMAALAYVQAFGETGDINREGFTFMLIAGLVAASAMILPGVSGGYMFLLMGVYVPILRGIDAFAVALKNPSDLPALLAPVKAVILPVGIGVVVGVVVVSNLLKLLLARCEKATLGALMGLLIGAVVGLWPFQQAVPLDEVAKVKGQPVTIVDDALIYTQTNKPVDFADYPHRPRLPESVGETALPLGFIVLGFATTVGLSLVGKPRRNHAD